MAEDESVKTLVAKLNLDATSVGGVIKDFKAQVASVAEEAKKQAAQDRAAVDTAVEGTKKQAAAQKEVTSAKKETAEAEKVGEEVAKQTSSRLQGQIAIIKEIIKQEYEHVVAAKEVQEATEKRTKSLEKEKGEAISLTEIYKKLAESSTEGAFGSGIIGSTIGGVLTGAGIGTAITLAIEGIGKLIEKTKEFIEDSGGLQKVTDTFQKLSKGVGANPTEFLDKLREATQHLVLDTDLLRAANSFLQSGVKMSADDMVKLTEATVGLARAQGNDAAQAIQNLNRAFLSGRTQTLGFTTGIQRQLLTLTGLGSTLSEQAKTNLSFAQTVKIIEERYENLGQPMLTYTDRLQQLKVVQASFFEDTAQAAVKSAGFTIFMEQLGKIIARFGNLEELSKSVGNAVGDMFALMTVAMQNITPTLHSIATFISEIFGGGEEGEGGEGKTRTSFKSLADQTAYFNESLQSTHPVLNATIKLVAGLGAAISSAAVLFKYFRQTVVGGIAAGSVAATQAYDSGDKNSWSINKKFWKGVGDQNQEVQDSTQKQLKEIQDNYDKSVGSAQAAMVLHADNSGGGVDRGKPVGDPGLARREALANAKAAMDSQVANAKASLAAVKEMLEDEAALNEKMYKEGSEDAAKYYKNKDDAAKMSRDATIAALQQEAAARKHYVDIQVAQHSVFASAARTQKAAIDAQTDTGTNQANTTYAKSVSSDSEGLFADQKATINAQADLTLTIQRTALAEQVDATKKAFQQNQIDSEEYYAEREEQIKKEADLVVAAEAKKVLTVRESAASQLKIEEALQKSQKEKSGFEANFPQEQYQNAQAYFGKQLGINSAQQGIASVTGIGSDELKTQQEAILQSQISTLTLYNSQLDTTSQLWATIYQTILKAEQQLKQLQQEQSVNNSATSLSGGLLGAIGSAGSGLFTGTFGKGFMQSLSAGAGFLKQSSGISQQWTGDTGQDTKNVFSALKQSIVDVSHGDSGSFKELTGTLTTATEAIGGFAKVIASATSPLGGAFGGAQAGAGLGQSLGLGPLGAIGGAAGGAILGAIVGQKQQQVQQDIVNIQLAARQMQEAFSAGSASLNSTIQTLQGLIATLTQEQSSSKKGSSQFQDLINQYNQQLAQLEAQQTQVIQQMTQQLASVSAPNAYQQWIQNIESVIQQYSQFAGAAQNATELAQANEYLTSSLQNIGQQMGDQLMQDEESAIQNALQLNQLYNQRNQLELQYLNQVQQIMSQGNLTRQRTQAQSAFSQLYDAQVNYSQQLDSINQQINLAQYQLSVEQQIFSLATTKAGLESQLLGLQEQGVNEDMQRIAALQNLLKTLGSSGYSIANLGSLSANDPNALQNTLLQDLVNELNTGQGTMIQQLQSLLNLLSNSGGFGAAGPASATTVPPSPNAITDTFAAAYQARASFGYGAFRSQNL